MTAVKFLNDNPNAYWLGIYVPIAVWLVLIIVLFILLLRKYTFGNWTPEHKNPHDGETFDMPRGIFRGIITLTLLYVAIILELANVRIIGLELELREFLIAFQMMIAFYFGSKVMDHITSVDKRKTEYVSKSATEISFQNNNKVIEKDDFDIKDAQG